MESMSATPTECLPAEIITEEILIKLPVKSLLRFKCVRKSWCSLISSRRFISRHYSDDSNQNCLLIRNSRIKYSIHNASNHPRIKESDLLPQMPTNVSAALLGPENGVFCFNFDYGRICLLNPAMRELRLLPQPTPFRLNGYYPEMGFGFDPSTGDYKVVISGWVYTSSTDSWKEVEMGLSKVWWFGWPKYKAFLNGVYYWCMGYQNGLSYASGIVAFDMRSERFEEIFIPDCIEFSNASPRRVIEYGDSIALQSCTRYDGFYDRSVCDDLWVRGKDGCWSRRKNDLAIDERSEVEARLRKTNVGPSQDIDVYSYKESLVSIKGGGGGDAAFLQDLFHGRPISQYQCCRKR